MMLAYFSNWLIFFPVAFSLFVAMRLSRGSVDVGKGNWAIIAMRGMIALMFLFSLLAIGLRSSPVSLFWLFLLAIFGLVLFWKSRRLARSALLLTSLGECDLTRQHALVGYFYNENAGWIRRKAGGLARDLAAGIPWERSLEKRGIAQTVFERLALRLRAAHGLEQQNERRDESNAMLTPLQIEAEAERLLGRLMILSWVIFIPVVVAFIVTFVLPTFRQMFEEFGIPFPGSTQVLMNVSAFSTQYGLVYLTAAALTLLTMLAAMLAFVWLSPSLTQLPVLRWLCRDYYRNAGFIALASLLNRDHDVLSACRETVQLVPVTHVAQAYQAATILMEQGASPATAFQKSHLLSKRELKAFGMGLTSGDPAWGLRELASWKTERMLNRYSVIVQVLVVVITLLMAVIVGLVAVGIMGALATLIDSLS